MTADGFEPDKVKSASTESIKGGESNVCHKLMSIATCIIFSP